MKDATTDPDTIRTWWRKWPKANIGIALEPAGLLVLDLDSPQALEEAKAKGLPPSPVVKTGRGEHRYFRNPWPGMATSTKRGASNAIDIKTTGFTVAPPSVHRSGRVYEWALSPLDAPLVDAPAWIGDLLHPRVDPEVAALPDDLPKIDVEKLALPKRVRGAILTGETKGYPSRSEAGFDVIAHLVKAGLSNAEIAGVILRYPIGQYVFDRARGDEDRARAWLAAEIARVRTKVGRQPPETITAPALLRLELPPISWTVENILPEGLAVVAGMPKIGKSWLALGLSTAVVMGKDYLGHPTVRGEAFYIALEDTKRRLKARLEALGVGEQGLDGLRFATEWPRAHEGGLEELRRYLTDHPRTRLVVIDTLQRMRPPRIPGGDVYEADYMAMATLKQLADAFGITILVVHHTRKMPSADPLTTVSGTYGITGGADTVLVLRRSRGEADAVLHVMGRDIEDATLALSFEAGRWTYLGDAREWAIAKERREILEVMRDLGGEAKPKAVAEILGKKPAAVQYLMARMARDGLLKQTRYGVYGLNKHRSP